MCSLFYKYVISWLFSALKDLLPLEWLYLKGQLELNPVPSVLVLYVCIQDCRIFWTKLDYPLKDDIWYSRYRLKLCNAVKIANTSKSSIDRFLN